MSAICGTQCDAARRCLADDKDADIERLRRYIVDYIDPFQVRPDDFEPITAIQSSVCEGNEQ
jgi:hypothetical protein